MKRIPEKRGRRDSVGRRRTLRGTPAAALAPAAAPALVDSDLARLCGAAPGSPFHAATIRASEGYILALPRRSLGILGHAGCLDRVRTAGLSERPADRLRRRDAAG